MAAEERQGVARIWGAFLTRANRTPLEPLRVLCLTVPGHTARALKQLPVPCAPLSFSLPHQVLNAPCRLVAVVMAVVESSVSMRSCTGGRDVCPEDEAAQQADSQPAAHTRKLRNRFLGLMMATVPVPDLV